MNNSPANPTQANVNSLVYPFVTSPAPQSPTVKAKLAAALVKTQSEMGDATKGAANPFFKSKYADLNAIREAVLPAANKNGLVVLQPTIQLGGKNYVRTLVIHESGEEMYADTEILCAKPNDPQAHGSGISYARRYGLQAFFNVGAVDDDGEAAQGREKPASAKTPAKATPAVTAAPATAAPVTNPGTESVAAATVEGAKKSTSFRRPKTETAATATPAPVTETKAPVNEEENWT